MKTSKTNRATGLTFMLDKNLEGKKKIFVHLCGNSQATVLTQEGAHGMALWLRDLADLIEDDWSFKVEE